MGRVMTGRRHQVLRAAARSAARAPKGRLRTVVGYDDSHAPAGLGPHTALFLRLVLDCGHIVRPARGPFGADDLLPRIGARRQCVPCAALTAPPEDGT